MSTEPLPESSASLLVADNDGDISLLEILDHVLNSGVVIHGSLVISLAGVDLVYIGLNVVLTSVETALRSMNHEGGGLRNESSPQAS
ncbi:MAG: gas vesicle protein [Candidatus Korobacteraceae bacterium]